MFALLWNIPGFMASRQSLLYGWYSFHRPLLHNRRLLFLIFMAYLIKLIAAVILSYQ